MGLSLNGRHVLYSEKLRLGHGKGRGVHGGLRMAMAKKRQCDKEEGRYKKPAVEKTSSLVPLAT